MKILITSNYLIRSDGGNSFRRRAEIFEFARTYNRNFTPIDDFGKLFFTDWDNVEWNNFYYFMLSCVVDYFKNGIPKRKNEVSPSIINARQSQSDISSFHLNEYAEKKVIKEIEKEGKLKIHKKEYYQSFLEEYPFYKDTLSQIAFTKFLKEIAVSKNYTIQEFPKNTRIYLLFKK